ncbi:TRAP transporter small permease [Cryobacterium sp. Y62]|uniref:TRAP transporter small permease n=1 Tax=Cryobacterium sp. Y62 TaxID=2048284 RepID=UPI0018EA6400|nr:TRAP transporter small permease subunit [Cryobacterium sp. Y62]
MKADDIEAPSAPRWDVSILAAIVAVMLVLGLGQVIFRYFFTSLVWSEEVLRYLMPWLTYIGAGVALRIGGQHLVLMSAPFSNRSPRLKLVIEILQSLIAVSLYALLAYHGTFLVIDLWDLGMSSLPGVSIGFMYAAIPVGTAYLAFITGRDVWKSIRHYRASAVNLKRG